MLKSIFTFLLSIVTWVSFAQQKPYQFSVDLTNIDNDRLKVELNCPSFSQKKVVYNIAKTVPGTYSYDDYGRYVEDFKAFDAKGKKLKVKVLDKNRYQIDKANKLSKITYWVNDTWDSPEIKGEHVFEPTGTNIDKSHFVINNHGFFGYFDGLKKHPYQINFKKPADFYGASSLTPKAVSNIEDIFEAESYNLLVDSPILYSKPDTTIIKMGDAEILVSVHSPKAMVTSAEIAENIKTTLEAQKDYLGGKLPIKKYAFLIILADVAPGSSYGALEHSYSSLYYLPESNAEELSQTIKDVASHEFFHIVTPLNIHSEEIGDFDFNDPKMSQHLWMYEGLTEYAAGHMQMKHGLIDLPKYLNMLRNKIRSMNEQYSTTLPFTEMSKGVLTTHKKEYANVYEKGALIGLCLDIRLRELSMGKYGTQNLMKDLAKNYGKDVSFKDDELFDKIVTLTYPEIRTFINTYIAGKEPLPVGDFLHKVGIDFTDSQKVSSINFGDPELSYNPETQRIFVKSIDRLNKIGEALGYKVDDEIISFNDQPFGIDNVQNLLTTFMKEAKNGDELKLTVLRKDAKGDKKEVKLSTILKATEVTQKYVLKPTDNPSFEQLRLKDWWLEPERN